jgi:hypothetical protein
MVKSRISNLKSQIPHGALLGMLLLVVLLGLFSLVDPVHSQIPGGAPFFPAVANWLVDKGSEKYNVLGYGAVADERMVTDAVTTAGSATVTSATAAFTSADNARIAKVSAGAAGFAAGTYVSGGSFTGAAGTTCTVSSFNGGGSGAMGTLTLTGTNTVAGGTYLGMLTFGSGYTTSSTSATLSAGPGPVPVPAACSGTITVAATTLYYLPIVTSLTVVNSTTATLGANAVFSVTGATLSIGTDNASAFAATAAAAYAAGAPTPTWYAPPGNYLYTGGMSFAHSVTVRCEPGAHLDYAGTAHAVDIGPASGLSFINYDNQPYLMEDCGFQGAEIASEGIYVNQFLGNVRLTELHFGSTGAANSSFGYENNFELYLAGEAWHLHVDHNSWWNTDAVVQGPGGYCKAPHQWMYIGAGSVNALDNELWIKDNMALNTQPIGAGLQPCLGGIGIWDKGGYHVISHNDIAWWNPMVRVASQNNIPSLILSENTLEMGAGAFYPGPYTGIQFGEPGGSGEVGGMQILNNQIQFSSNCHFLGPGNSSELLTYTRLIGNQSPGVPGLTYMVYENNLAGQPMNIARENFWGWFGSIYSPGSNITPWYGIYAQGPVIVTGLGGEQGYLSVPPATSVFQMSFNFDQNTMQNFDPTIGGSFFNLVPGGVNWYWVPSGASPTALLSWVMRPGPTLGEDWSFGCGEAMGGGNCYIDNLMGQGGGVILGGMTPKIAGQGQPVTIYNNVTDKQVEFAVQSVGTDSGRNAVLIGSHVVFPVTSAPTVTGAGCSYVRGNDSVGVIAATGPDTCTVTFASPFTSPVCLVTATVRTEYPTCEAYTTYATITTVAAGSVYYSIADTQ